MWAVLKAKFVKGSIVAHLLLETEDAFLLEHNEVAGRDKVWSDNHDGEGTNWLGLQLMLLRDELRCEEGQAETITETMTWTQFIEKRIDLNSGKPLSDAHKLDWQNVVRQ